MVARDYKKVFDDSALRVAQNQASINRANSGVKGIEDVGWERKTGRLSVNTGVEDADYNERKYTTMRELPKRFYGDKNRAGPNRLRKRRVA
jgi:hypothetical protein